MEKIEKTKLVNGKDGKDGKNGIGIAGAIIDKTGNLLITLDNKQTLNVGKIVAIDGKPGGTGNGIMSAQVNAAGQLVVTYTDGKSVIAGKVIGPPGTPGASGKDGKLGTIRVEVIRNGSMAETFNDVEDRSRLRVIVSPEKE